MSFLEYENLLLFDCALGFLLHLCRVQFWKICPMEHILARLESDSRPVCRRLVGLIFNSFLPVNQPEAVWCERCVALL